MSFKRYRDWLSAYIDNLAKYAYDIETHINRHYLLLDDKTTYLSWLPRDVFEILLEYIELETCDYEYHRKIYNIKYITRIDDELIDTYGNEMMIDAYYAILEIDMNDDISEIPNLKLGAISSNRSYIQQIVRILKQHKIIFYVKTTNFESILNIYPEAINPLKNHTICITDILKQILYNKCQTQIKID